MKKDLLPKEEPIDKITNTHLINMPNTIKYPKNASQLNNQNTSEAVIVNNNNNPTSHMKNKSNQDDDSSQDKLPKKRISGKVLIGLITFVIIYEYYIYVFLLYESNTKTLLSFSPKLLILLVYHILLFMMIWSFIVTTKTIPGVIPLYWGFYIGDEEYKRKRYCLICNAFKPERSHHCSVCNICVLNMDHHCPWVNNCIGFYNRKFFMQLLFYLFLLLWYIVITTIPFIYQIAHHLYVTRMKIPDFLYVKYITIVPGYLLVCILTVLNTMFFKYHITLVLNNSTTIESLDKDSKEFEKFKLSYYENWAQVFGFDSVLWFFPVFSESGRPNGDGLNWKISSSYD